MGEYIRETYTCSDNMSFNKYADAWEHERRIRFPKLLVFDSFGNYATGLDGAEYFIVNSMDEVKFVNDMKERLDKANVWDYDPADVTEGSLIYPYAGRDYTVYSHDFCLDESMFIYNNWCERDCDLRHELWGF